MSPFPTVELPASNTGLAVVFDFASKRRRSSSVMAIRAEWHGQIGVLTVTGVIDASSVASFTHRVQQRMLMSRMLILDMTGVRFCAVAGFHALRSLNESRAIAGADWVIVPGAPVQRLLELCDLEGELPIAPTMDAAWSASAPSRWPA